MRADSKKSGCPFEAEDALVKATDSFNYYFAFQHNFMTTNSRRRIMTSRRSWLLGLALGAALSFGSPSAYAQVPRSISYQGLVLNGITPLSGSHSIVINYYDGAILLGSETFPTVTFVNGVFNIILGSALGGFPPNFTFANQYSMTVSIDGSAQLPATFMESAPYALNAQTVGGLAVSATPVNGSLFPIPLNSKGHISTSILPLATINGVSGAASVTGDTTNIDLVGASGITITPNANHTITIAGPAASNITSVLAGAGLQNVGSPTGPIVTLTIAPGGVVAADIAPGAVLPGSLNASVVSTTGAISQNVLGQLQANVDNSTIGIVADALEVLPHSIGATQLAPGLTPAGVLVGPDLLSTPFPVVNPTTLVLDLNLAHSNTWTVPQNFNGITDIGGISTTSTLGVTGLSSLNGGFTTGATGNGTIGGNLAVTGTSTLTGNVVVTTGSITATTGGLQNTPVGSVTPNTGKFTNLTTTVGPNTFAGTSSFAGLATFTAGLTVSAGPVSFGANTFAVSAFSLPAGNIVVGGASGAGVGAHPIGDITFGTITGTSPNGIVPVNVMSFSDNPIGPAGTAIGVNIPFGSMAAQNANNVNITGGTITGTAGLFNGVIQYPSQLDFIQTGGLLDVQQNTANGTGGNLTINGGAAGVTSATPVAAAGGNITLTGGAPVPSTTALTGSAAGSNVSITAGAGAGSVAAAGAGGIVSITGGLGGSSSTPGLLGGAGGNVSIAGGAATATPGGTGNANGGILALSSGAAVGTGTSGTITISTPAGSVAGGSTGGITISTGTQNGAGTRGQVNVSSPTWNVNSGAFSGITTLSMTGNLTVSAVTGTTLTLPTSSVAPTKLQLSTNHILIGLPGGAPTSGTATGAADVPLAGDATVAYVAVFPPVTGGPAAVLTLNNSDATRHDLGLGSADSPIFSGLTLGLAATTPGSLTILSGNGAGGSATINTQNLIGPFTYQLPPGGGTLAVTAPGGYLPLTAGNTVPLTGDLYFSGSHNITDVTSGAGVNGTNLSLIGGTGGTGNTNGGNAAVTGGAGVGTGTNGSVSITSGTGGTVAGGVTIQTTTTGTTAIGNTTGTASIVGSTVNVNNTAGNTVVGNAAGTTSITGNTWSVTALGAGTFNTGISVGGAGIANAANAIQFHNATSNGTLTINTLAGGPYTWTLPDQSGTIAVGPTNTNITQLTGLTGVIQYPTALDFAQTGGLMDVQTRTTNIAGGALTVNGGAGGAGATGVAGGNIAITAGAAAGTAGAANGGNVAISGGTGINTGTPGSVSINTTAGNVAIGNATGTVGITSSNWTVAAATGAISTPGTINTTGSSAITAGGALAAGTTVTASGLISSTAGAVSAFTTMTAGGNITSTGGNVAATTGNVTAGGSMTAGGNITSTTGNIAATTGNVTAGGSMTAGTGITATTGNITATQGNLMAGSALHPGTLALTNNGGFTGTVDASLLTAARSYQLPDQSGTLAVVTGGVNSNITSMTGLTGVIQYPTALDFAQTGGLLNVQTATTNIAGGALTINGGQGGAGAAGTAGGSIAITGGAANGSTPANGGNVAIAGGTGINGGTMGNVNISTAPGTGNTSIGNATGTVGITSSTWNVSTAGAITGTTSYTGSGNITSTTGNIAATLGSVSAGTTVTATGNITSNTGNVTATHGVLAAGATFFPGTLALTNTGGFTGTVDASLLTAPRSYQLPDNSGTLLTTTALGAYLPLAGGTMSGDINMGGHNITNAGALNGASLNINNTGGNNTAIGNATGTVAVTSSSWNVTGAGAVTGVTTLTTTANGSTMGSTASNAVPALTVQNLDNNAVPAAGAGTSALKVLGGIAANNQTGVDGTGYTAGTQQLNWADQVVVPTATTTNLTIFNNLVGANSVIIITQVSNLPTVVPVITLLPITTAGQFTITASANMGTAVGGNVQDINYMIVNH